MYRAISISIKRLKTNPTRNTVNLTESQWPQAEDYEEIVVKWGDVRP